MEITVNINNTMKNKNLETLFNLPDISNDISDTPSPTVKQLSNETLTTVEKIDKALTRVKGLDADDSEMDALSESAKKAFEEILDLGYQVDSRSAGDILGIASQFLGHAITAKTAKINKKLKMIDLQLKKAKLEADKLKNAPELVEEVQGTIMDRNELLAEILAQQKNK